VRGAAKKVNKLINEIGLASETAPGQRPSARSKQDKAATIAQDLIFELFDGRPSSDFSLKNFDNLWTETRPKISRYLDANPSVLAELVSENALRSDDSPGRRKARVLESIRLRMRALVGLKGLR
jgi:hypothetical protein